MNNQLNIRSIEAFENLSETNIERIQSNAEFIRYGMGSPILSRDTIPNTVLIILSGKARLIHSDSFESNSTLILKPDSFIGLPSLLCAAGCEEITASTELLAMSLSDDLVIDLYKEESSFKKWCDSKVNSAEIYKLSNLLKQNIPHINVDFNDLIEILSKNIKIEVFKNGSCYTGNKSTLNFIGSANTIDNKIGDIIQSNKIINTKGIFPARTYNFPLNLYTELTSSNTNQLDKSHEKDIENIEFNKTGSLLESSNQEVGQYQPKKEFKIIKAKGNLRESLACLQMIANQLELPYRRDSIEKILRDSIRKDKKPTLQLLGSITSSMGLHSTIAKVSNTMGNRIPAFSLISWKNSFAIVTDSNSINLEIMSPSEGLIQLNPDEVIDIFDKGFIELLLVEKNEKSPNKKFGLQWFLPVLSRYRLVLFQVLLASAVVQLLGLANPLMIQVVIDKVISQRSLDTLQILGLALVITTILGSILSSLRTFLFAETTNRIDTRLGAEVIDHLLRLPLNYFDKRPVGELGSRVAELEKIRNFLTGQALTTILDSLFSIIYIFIMFIYSWLLSLIALIVVPIQMIITFIGAPLIRRQIREIAQENAKTQSHLVEVLTGVQTVKAQNVENISRWKWQELYSKYISKSFQKTITSTALGESSQVLQQLSQLLVLWIGAQLVLEGQLSLGQLIAFRIISGFVTQPLLRLSTIWQNIQELRVSFERLADIIDTNEEADQTERSKLPLPKIEGLVEFKNVSFNFIKGKPNVLNNINLKIKPGEFIGVVGQSGSGKSTLMKLLPRLYKPQKGNIFIDGYDIEKVELYSLRRQIGIVPQEPLLFAGSINDNIALTDPEASNDDIVNASKISNAHDFIMSLSEGYSTNIGERGAGLSGGQKQRIAIARTLLSKPKLLIMDEATSALDYDTERKVCEGIRNACIGSSVFFITHRLSTVRNSDLIIMLHEGCIVETGTHQELMNMQGRYYALYRQQEST